MSDVPQGWQKCALSSVVKTRSGNSTLIKGRLSPEPSHGLFPAFSASGQDVFCENAEHEGDALVLSAVGARCGKCFRARGKWSAIANTHIVWPRPEAVSADYLFLLLNDETFWIRGGSAQPFVKVTDSLKKEVVIPPLAEQRRLVARIEALTSRLEQARQARQAALAEAKSAQAALVDAVFSKRDGDWEEASVKQLCGQPQYGYTESASREQVGPHFLRITDIQDGKVNWETVPFCPCAEPAKYRLADRDIVFARTGATTGKSYLVHNPPEAVFASYLIRIRPGSRVLPEYVWWYFQSDGYWASVFSGIEDGNRPNMNGSKLAELRIPFPKSKDEQRRIIARLDTLGAKQAELRRLQTETEAALSAFTPALLAKAFRGEL